MNNKPINEQSKRTTLLLSTLNSILPGGIKQSPTSYIYPLSEGNNSKLVPTLRNYPESWIETTPLRYRFQHGLEVRRKLKLKTLEALTLELYHQVQPCYDKNAIPTKQAKRYPLVLAGFHHIVSNLCLYLLTPQTSPLQYCNNHDNNILCHYSGEKSNLKKTTFQSIVDALVFTGYLSHRDGIIAVDYLKSEFQILLRGVTPTTKFMDLYCSHGLEGLLDYHDFKFQIDKDITVCHHVYKKLVTRVKVNTDTGEEITKEVKCRMVDDVLYTKIPPSLKPVLGKKGGGHLVPKLRAAMLNHEFSHTVKGKQTRLVPGYHGLRITRIFNAVYDKSNEHIIALHGGRYYKGFWQNILRDDRETLTIDGELAYPHDWTAAQFNLLYFLHTRQAYQGDPDPRDPELKGNDVYAIGGSFFDEDYTTARKILKLLLLPLLGAGRLSNTVAAAISNQVKKWRDKDPGKYSYLERWVTEQEQYEIDQDMDAYLNYSMNGGDLMHWNPATLKEPTLYERVFGLVLAFVQKHRVIFPDQKPMALAMQRLESDILTDVMEEFLDRTGGHSCVLPMHDECIVAMEHKGLIDELMIKHMLPENVERHIKLLGLRELDVDQSNNGVHLSLTTSS